MRDPAQAADPGRILRRSIALGVLVSGSRLFAFAAIVAAARHFPASEFGSVSLAQQIAAIALMASAWGLDLYAIKLGVERPAELGSIASTVLLLRLGLGALAFAGALALGLVVPGWRSSLAVTLCFTLSVFSGAISMAWVAQAVRRTGVFGLAQVASQLLYLVFVGLVILLDLPVWGVGAALVLGEVLTALGLLAWMSARVAPLARPLGWTRARALLARASPIGAGQVTRAAALGSDIVLLGMLSTLEETGWYGGAYRIYLFALSLLAVYFVVLFPNLVERAAEGMDPLRHEVERSLARTVVPCALLVSVAAWIAPGFLALLFGAEFERAGASLRILLVASLVVLLNGHARQALLAAGRQQADLRNVLASSMVHAASKLLLIPLWGITGAAAGTLLGESALLWLSWRNFGRAEDAGGGTGGLALGSAAGEERS